MSFHYSRLEPAAKKQRVGGPVPARSVLTSPSHQARELVAIDRRLLFSPSSYAAPPALVAQFVSEYEYLNKSELTTEETQLVEDIKKREDRDAEERSHLNDGMKQQRVCKGQIEALDKLK